MPVTVSHRQEEAPVAGRPTAVVLQNDEESLRLSVPPKYATAAATALTEPTSATDGSTASPTTTQLGTPRTNQLLPQPKATQKFASDHFNGILYSVHTAIMGKKLHPERNDAGTSGSYICKDKQEKSVAVFKPRDEEPYAESNPKWSKWFQRKLSIPYMWGRGPLVDNTGYVAEAMAYRFATAMKWNIVPETHVVRLAAPTFHYADLPNNGDEHHPKELPPKTGSFQLFMEGVEPAATYKKDFLANMGDCAHDFRLQFEQLVILDYVTRQTDRQDDWFLILDREGDSKEGRVKKVQLYALDNGLAFPFKHPSDVRAYPFGWLSLPDANEPFLKETCEEVIKKFDNQEWRQQLVHDLHKIAKVDKHLHGHFHKQMEVMRGQMWNVLECLRMGGSPKALCELTPKLAHEHTSSSGLVVREWTKKPLLSFW